MERCVTIFKWLLALASILATIALVVFIEADRRQMRTLRSVAAGTLVLAGLLTLVAGLLPLYERRRH
jgi:hypothetical protein